MYWIYYGFPKLRGFFLVFLKYENSLNPKTPGNSFITQPNLFSVTDRWARVLFAYRFTDMWAQHPFFPFHFLLFFFFFLFLFFPIRTSSSGQCHGAGKGAQGGAIAGQERRGKERGKGSVGPGDF